MSPRPRLAAGAVAIATLALAGCAGAPGTGAAETGFVAGDSSVVRLSGQAEPVELTGRTRDGDPLDLAALRGQVVVLNVWGSWCAPCRAEAPALERVSVALRPAGVRFVGIDVKDEASAARAFAARFSTYPSVYDPDGRALLALRSSVPPSAIPSTLVLGRDGRPVTAVIGGVTEGKLRSVLAPLVPAAAGPQPGTGTPSG